jgi:L,D-transpeptidase catalytic domain
MRFLLCTLFWVAWLSCNSKSTSEKLNDGEVSLSHKKATISSDMLLAARDYCSKNKMNSKVALFTDMSVRSGERRFFVVNMDSDSIIYSGLVAHGHCQNIYSRKARFSNEVGSNCTSGGKYRIGGKYDGRFGTAYKLHGLDSTNSNAFERFVVLHAHPCVKDNPSLIGICSSEGCPTISPSFLQELEPIIDKSPSPILLWIYKSMI